MSAVIPSATVNASEPPMPDTINAETTLIEEDALIAESLRVESEPWTRFYLAGEIIRESRKASGKQRKYGSEGDMDHSDKVIDHYDHPCDVGSQPKDDPNGGIGLAGALECDDVMELQIRIKPEVQVIDGEAEFMTFGCGSAIVSSSLTTELVTGKSSRKRWPSRTRISSARSAFPATLLDATGYSGIGRRLHLVGSPIL
jgi:hypothetical protein